MALNPLGYTKGILTGGAHWTPGMDNTYGGVPAQMSQETKDLFASHVPPAGTSGAYQTMNPAALSSWNASSNPIFPGSATEARTILGNYNQWWKNAYGFTPTELTDVPSYTGTTNQNWTDWAKPLIEQYGRYGTNPLHPITAPTTSTVGQNQPTTPPTTTPVTTDGGPPSTTQPYQDPFTAWMSQQGIFPYQQNSRNPSSGYAPATTGYNPGAMPNYSMEGP